MRYLLKISLCTAIFFLITETKAEDGYRLWLRYDPVSDPAALAGYTESLKGWIIQGDSPTLKAAGKELQTGLNGLLGRNIPALNSVKKHGAIIAGYSLSFTIDRVNEINREVEWPRSGRIYYLKHKIQE